MKGEKFLEIGCGAGVTSIELFLTLNDAQIDCSDINPYAV